MAVFEQQNDQLLIKKKKKVWPYRMMSQIWTKVERPDPQHHKDILLGSPLGSPFHSIVFLLLIGALWPGVIVKNHFLKILPYMPELVGFQTMVIIDPYDLWCCVCFLSGLLSKSGSSYCESDYENADNN